MPLPVMAKAKVRMADATSESPGNARHVHTDALGWELDAGRVVTIGYRPSLGRPSLAGAAQAGDGDDLE
jgi:hypothetical protein